MLPAKTMHQQGQEQTMENVAQTESEEAMAENIPVVAQTLAQPEATTMTPREDTRVLTEMVLVDAITCEPALQMRAQDHHPNYIRELVAKIRDGRLTAGIVVFRNPVTREMHVADGFGRVAAFKGAGMREIPAVVHQGDRRDAWMYALGANEANGARRTNKDRRKAVTAALADAELSVQSDAVIAKACAVSDRFVAKLRAETTPPNGSGVESVRVGQDGKRYPARPRRASPPNCSPLSSATGTRVREKTPGEAPTSGEISTHPSDVDTVIPEAVHNSPEGEETSVTVQEAYATETAPAPPSVEPGVSTTVHTNGTLDLRSGDREVAPTPAVPMIAPSETGAAVRKVVENYRETAKHMQRKFRHLMKDLAALPRGGLRGVVGVEDTALLRTLRTDLDQILRVVDGATTVSTTERPC